MQAPEDSPSDEKPEWLVVAQSNNVLIQLIRNQPDIGLALNQMVREWFNKVHSRNPPYNFEIKKTGSGREYFRCSITTTLGLFKGEFCTVKDLSESSCLALLYGQLLFNEYSKVMVNEGGYLDIHTLRDAYAEVLASERMVGALTMAELQITKADLGSRITKMFSSQTMLVDKQADQDFRPRARRDLGMNLFNAWVAKQELLESTSQIWGRYEYVDFYQYVHRLFSGGMYEFYHLIADRELKDNCGFEIVEEVGEKFCISVGPSNPVPTWLSNRRAALSRRVNSSHQVVEVISPQVTTQPTLIDHEMVNF